MGLFRKHSKDTNIQCKEDVSFLNNIHKYMSELDHKNKEQGNLILKLKEENAQLKERVNDVEKIFAQLKAFVNGGKC